MDGIPSFDYGKLRGRIVEKYNFQKEFSKKMHMSEATLSKKLTGYTYFTQAEILRAAQLLDIELGDISSYFFAREVKKT